MSTDTKRQNFNITPEQEAEIAWVILAQAAQAVRDHELLQVASLCHEEAEARGKWLRTRIKESAPQVLATG